MKLKFTKMHGAGNDFIVIDATSQGLTLSPQQWQRLADRRFGIGADQILVVEAARTAGVDFRYRIYNADGGEVEQCGNGARAFMKFVTDRKLTQKTSIRVETMAGVITPVLQADGQVTVDMGAPVTAPELVPFDIQHLVPRVVGSEQLWPLEVAGRTIWIGALSMGNPHAVQEVENVDTVPVVQDGPLIESHVRFPQRVNAGFMQILARDKIRLRVFERGAGETLACGTGACAAVVSGIRRGLLDPEVIVETRGGVLTIAWAGDHAPVQLTGPAVTVFEGEIELAA
ncbi:MAG: diaminopimelate epimerase [Pseudomonadota bacterium]